MSLETEEPNYEFSFDVLIQFVDGERQKMLSDIGGISYGVNTVSFLWEKMKGTKFYKHSVVYPLHRIKKIETSIKELKVV